MSVEFWETMEKLEKKVKSIKFLENSHPEMGHFLENAKWLLGLTEDLEKSIAAQLREKAKNGRHNKPKSKGKTKI